LKKLAVLVLLAGGALAAYKLGVQPEDVKQGATDMLGKVREAVDTEAGPPAEPFGVYKQYAKAIGEQHFGRAERVSQGAAQQIAHQRGLALRTLKSGAKDRVYVAKSKQPKLRPVERGDPFLHSAPAYEHEVTHFEILDDGKILKLDVIETVTGEGPARRSRHLATVMKIGDTYKVTLFTELPAPQRESRRKESRRSKTRE
jgi:hypothetical protein